MSDEALQNLLSTLLDEIAEPFKAIRENDLFAHYTSIESLEKIISNDEIWFSNPLFMNDLDELKFGINQGRGLFQSSKRLEEACGTPERAKIVRDGFQYYFSDFDENHAINVYVLCLSFHIPDNDDGILSMWRAYGANGNGAALVFNSSFTDQDRPMPIVMAKVRYGTVEERLSWINKKIDELSEMIKNNKIPDDKLHFASYYFCSYLKMFALTSKHLGFQEEKEWRLIYMKDTDEAGVLADCLGYALGKHGVEPKLKLPIRPLPVAPLAIWTFESILERILLGPSLSSALAMGSIERMLDVIKKPTFKGKVRASTIP